MENDSILNEYKLASQLDFFGRNGFNEKKILKLYNNYISTAPNSPLGDFIWYVFLQLLDKNSRNTRGIREFHNINSDIYWRMYTFRRIHENRLEWKYLRKSWEEKIEADTTDFEGNKINIKFFTLTVISHGCCDYCESIDNKQYEIDDFLEHMPIVNGGCTTSHGSNATISLLYKRDADGTPLYLKDRK